MKKKSLAHAASIWRKEWDSRNLGVRTRSFYESILRSILAWAEENDDPTFGRALDRKRLKSLLKSFDDRESMRAGVKTVLNSLIGVALDEGWIESYPLEKVRCRRVKGKRAVAEWADADVADHENAALKAGWQGGANLYRAGWETGADATDICRWRKAENFIDDPALPRVMFERGKTGEVRDIPISHDLADRWRAMADHLVIDPEGRPYADDRVGDSRRGHDLGGVKADAIAAGARALLFDHLRHSAITDAVTKGATAEQATGLSQHKNTAVLERVYLQRNLARATIVQRARKIIGEEAA